MTEKKEMRKKPIRPMPEEAQKELDSMYDERLNELLTYVKDGKPDADGCLKILTGIAADSLIITVKGRLKAYGITDEMDVNAIVTMSLAFYASSIERYGDTMVKAITSGLNEENVTVDVLKQLFKGYTVEMPNMIVNLTEFWLNMEEDELGAVRRLGKECADDELRTNLERMCSDPEMCLEAYCAMKLAYDLKCDEWFVEHVLPAILR